MQPKYEIDAKFKVAKLNFEFAGNACSVEIQQIVEHGHTYC